jgi:hypothetical protein
VTPSFFHIASTYWKYVSVMSLLDLPLVSASTFLEGVLASPDSGQVRSSSGSHGTLSSLQTEDHVWFEDRWMVASLCDE